MGRAKNWFSMCNLSPKVDPWRAKDCAAAQSCYWNCGPLAAVFIMLIPYYPNRISWLCSTQGGFGSSLGCSSTSSFLDLELKRHGEGVLLTER